MPSSRHIPALDGLRAIAVLLVLWSHIPVSTPAYPAWAMYLRALLEPGNLGVEIFFVLSGFLITRILIVEREQHRPVRWFLLRRLLRIFPIYYLLLLIMLAVWPHAEIGWCAVYLSNVVTAFEPARDFPLQHTWSLCVEEHFYLLWPLVVAFTNPGRPVRILIFGVMPAALLAAFLVSGYGNFASPYRVVQHISLIRFFSLGAGCLLAYGEPKLRTGRWHPAALATVLIVFGAATNSVVQFVLVPHWFAIPPVLPFEIDPALKLLSTCSLATGLVLACLVWGERRLSPLRLMTWAPLRAIGRISYGLYLYHLPIFHTWLRPSPSWTNAAIVIGAAFGVATLSYWVIERPILRFGSKLR